MNFFSKTIPLSRRQILFPIAILFFTLATNGIILALCGYNPWEAVQVAIVGAFGDGRRITETLVKSVPFLFTGLAVAFSFRCGIWNIGAEGQFLLGAIASTWCGTQIAPHLPPILAIPLTLLAGAAAGGIWALMAALLKVYRGVQEVISTIMLNYVAIYLLSYMVDGGPLQEAAKRGPSKRHDCRGCASAAPDPADAIPSWDSLWRSLSPSYCQSSCFAPFRATRFGPWAQIRKRRKRPASQFPRT